MIVSCKDSTTKVPNLDSLTIDLSSAKKYMKTLSSDEYEGRKPCSQGEEKTVAFLRSEMKKMGLQAPKSHPDYTQNVKLVDIDGHPDENMTLQYDDKTISLQSSKDYVIHTQRMQDEVGIKDSELVFCGYGIVAPERGWNDFEGVDLKGKTAVVMINDPGFGSEDSTFFKGDVMTYYGRWTYKYEEADRQGAAGLLIVHETASAGYPWFVVQSSWSGSQQGLAGIDRSNDCGVKGLIHLETTKQLFANAGLDFSKELKLARTKDFKAKSLKAKATVNIKNDNLECDSKNLIGYIPGSKYPDEYIVYTAHWDHLGIGNVVEGDSIYNGALDNATGVAAVLSIAKAFAESEQKPERSVVFLFVTAEEQGLLGSEYYVKNPIFPLAKTVCNLNMDGVNPAGAMKDLTITGLGHSEMDDIATQIAQKHDRYVIPESEPEKGYFFRSDHFNFAKFGVPALYAEGGYDHLTKGKAFAQEFKDTYVAKNYHAPSDEYNEATWNYDGFVQDANLYLEIGQLIANNRTWPKWKDGSEFSR